MNHPPTQKAMNRFYARFNKLKKMFKVRYSNERVIKSFDILDIFNYVIKNPEINCDFFIEYTPYSKSQFLKLFLQINGNYKNHILFYAAINPQITLKNYVKTSN